MFVICASLDALSILVKNGANCCLLTALHFFHNEFINSLNQSFMQKIPGWAENMYSLFCMLIAQQLCKKSSSYTGV